MREFNFLSFLTGTAKVGSPFVFPCWLDKQPEEVRSLLLDGEPWFVASDVCAAIEVDRTAVRRLDDDEKGVHLMHTPGGEQGLGLINEFGLYSLILSSRKP